MKLILLTVLIAAVAIQANAADNYPHDGAWKPIAAVLGGTPIPQPALNAITLRVSGTNYEVTVRGEKVPDQGWSTRDTATHPKRITLTSTNGPNKGKTFLGIYEMKDTNSMRVCYDLSGTAFPEKFESAAETGHYLAEYRRIAPKAAPKATDAADDARRQNGVWKPAGAILDGAKLSRKELNEITLTIKDGAYEVVVEGEAHADKGTVTLDTSVIPKRMRIESLEGANKGKTILAIYEMGQANGRDTFRVCYDLSGKAYPKDFKSPKGSMHYLVGYRRQTDMAPSAPARKESAP